MKPKLLDTQKAEELGLDGTSNLEGPWAVTSYTNEEFVNHGFRIYPADTTFVQADSWPDFILKFSNGDYTLWEWQTPLATWQIQYYAYGFGKAPCGHTATIMVSGGGNTYHLCDGFHTSNADMSNFTAVIEGLAKYPFTGDTCLGKTCKVYQEMESSNSTSNEQINHYGQQHRNTALQTRSMETNSFQRVWIKAKNPVDGYQSDATKVDVPRQINIYNIGGEVNYNVGQRKIIFQNKTNKFSIVEKLSLVLDKLFSLFK